MKDYKVVNVFVGHKEASIALQSLLNDGYVIVNSVAVQDCVQYIVCKDTISEDKKELERLIIKARLSSIGL